MNYGYFDNKNKEYVITRPDTPSPWFNYLGNGKFSGIISNNAGGLLFDGDPGSRRMTKYKFDSVPMDRPGRYLYIRDMDTGEYWSAAWQPVLKPLENYECRHGLGYTIIKSTYSQIETEITYFIPEDKCYEIWQIKIKNLSGKKRTLKLFSYMEMSFYDAQVDMTMEWARYFMTSECDDGIIIFDPTVESCSSGNLYSFMATSLNVEGFDCSRNAFIGNYRNEQNPIAVEQGYCSNKNLNADYCCCVLCSEITFEKEETKEFIFTVGTAKEKSEIASIVKEATNIENSKQALVSIKSKWNKYLEFCQVETPDDEINTMLNLWHPYQCSITFNWSRYISYYERGIARGWGFRDSMQDVLGIIHANAQDAKQKIITLLGIQLNNGSAFSVYFPATKTADGGGRSDDHLWSVFSVCTYLRETGDYEFLNEIVPYADGGSGSVLEHLLKGLEFTKTNVGIHGIPKFLTSDWNDSLGLISLQQKAESVFVFFQAGHAAYELIQLFSYLKDAENLKYAEEYYAWCKSLMPKVWDGEWFLRAYTDDGEKFGTVEDEYNKIFLNPQSWAVLSRLATQEQGNIAFDNVEKYLSCKFGLISHYPAYGRYNPEKKSYLGCEKGVKENGGVFFHANTWAVIAETLLGRSNEAFKIYKSSLPAARNDCADVCLIEPYVYASAMLGPCHDRFGAGSNSWLTGTASWMYFAATQYILGFRPEHGGIVISPCIPDSWTGFKMTRMYRGIKCNYEFKNSTDCVGKKIKISVDDVVMDGNFINYESICNKQEVNLVVYYD